MNKSYQEFREAIGMRESSDRYDLINEIGYLGRYQFGTARLADFGLCKRIENTAGFANQAFEFVEPFSQEIFLSNKELQDACFDYHVWMYGLYIQHRYGPLLGKSIKSFTLDLSGCMGVVHLLGPGGLADLIIDGKNDNDQFGTTALEYLNEFSGYDLINIKPNTDFKSFL